MEKYQGETVVISSRVYWREMRQQLLSSGVEEAKIIMPGKMQVEWEKEQYFDFIAAQDLPHEKEIFVDGGGFDGATTKEFAKWCGEKENYSYIFEPSEKNIAKCHSNLDAEGIKYEIIDRGLWGTEACLHFHDAGDIASKIDPDGECEVKVTSIDKALAGKEVTFVKIDIEGAEKEALMGAKETIRKYKPMLAISIYHKPEDMWELPQLIMEYCPEYRFYLRHYSLGFSETVLYAVCE